MRRSDAGDDAAPPRRFFLERTPEEGAPTLAEHEHDHALRVLRLAPGARILGLDGRGCAWPLLVSEISGAKRHARLVLAADGPPLREPAPGSPGAVLPRLELLCSLPRGPRAEDLVDRATQIGAAAVTFFLGERASDASRGAGAARLDRLRGAAREACKQAVRLWLPEIEAPRPFSELLSVPAEVTFLLDPRASADLLPTVAARRAAGEPRSWRVIVGPEGGFTAAERAGALAAGAQAVRLTPHVLRIEAAAEVALAGLALALARR